MRLRRVSLAIALVAALATGCALQRPDPVDTSVETGGAAAATRRVPRHLEVVSFNVKYRGAGELIGAFRSDRTLRRADVVFLQEMESHPREKASRARKLARALGMSYVYAPGYGFADGGSHGLAILSRYPIALPRVIELPRYNVHVNSGRPIALAATIRIGGRPVRVYNVHLTNRINPAQRRRQLRPVLEMASADPVHQVIIGGDFNTSWFVWGAHLIPFPAARQPRMIDRLVRGYGFATPMAKRDSTSAWLNMRLDSIYTRGVRVTQKGVRKGVIISDHFPIWVQISWPPPELPRLGLQKPEPEQKADHRQRLPQRVVSAAHGAARYSRARAISN
jgi:endonuclease/exonuclease/phosphatase family metal-dependent hydrolase